MEQSLQVMGQEAQQCHNKILHLKKIMSVGFLTIGKELKSMKDRNYWKFIVGQDMTWKDYCKEIDFNLNYADILIKLYGQFILRLEFSEEEIAEIDQRKLIALLPHLGTDRQEIVKLIEDAKVLSRSDFFLRLNQIKNPPENCEHEPKETHYWYCVKCKEKLNEEEIKKYAK